MNKGYIQSKAQSIVKFAAELYREYGDGSAKVIGVLAEDILNHIDIDMEEHNCTCGYKYVRVDIDRPPDNTPNYWVHGAWSYINRYTKQWVQRADNICVNDECKQPLP